MQRILRGLPRALAAMLMVVVLVSCNKKGPTIPTSGGGSSGAGELNGNLAALGGQYAHTFATAGAFSYRCSIHPTCSSLAGTIVVLAPGGTIQNRVLGISQSGGTSDPYGGSTCSALSLQRDTVFAGDRVTWTNNSPFPHTVTSQ